MHAFFHEGGPIASGVIGGRPGPPWYRLLSVMGARTVGVWSGRVAAGAARAIIACPRVRQTAMIAGMEARHGHAGRRETTPARDPRRARA